MFSIVNCTLTQPQLLNSDQELFPQVAQISTSKEPNLQSNRCTVYPLLKHDSSKWLNSSFLMENNSMPCEAISSSILQHRHSLETTVYQRAILIKQLLNHSSSCASFAFCNFLILTSFIVRENNHINNNSCISDPWAQESVVKGRAQLLLAKYIQYTRLGPEPIGSLASVPLSVRGFVPVGADSHCVLTRRHSGELCAAPLNLQLLLNDLRCHSRKKKVPLLNYEAAASLRVCVCLCVFQKCSTFGDIFQTKNRAFVDSFTS